MNVTCGACATVYRIDPAKVPPAGVRARCVCDAVFWVRLNSEPVTAGPGAGAAAVVRACIRNVTAARS